ncbi:R3H domain-containing nucleic acid-binding protein [Paractinoplanes aksuensis]|uniref:Jag family protein n=1 Tax=Paractinoplanes aksuensis TaxID=2939490 RepID=UPI0021114AF1
MPIPPHGPADRRCCRGNSGPRRSGPIEYGDETVTDTSTPESSVSESSSSEAASTATSTDASAGASTEAATGASTEASTAEETKTSETVASDGDLFRQSEIAADYIEGLLDILDYDGDIDELVSAGRPMVEVVGGRLQPLVGQRGATLEALQELTRLAIFRATGSPSRLLLDIGGYRASRRKELAAVARNAVEKVKEHGDPVRLEPMSAFERKCVHDVVNAISGVQSESEGVEPSRRIVVRVAD